MEPDLSQLLSTGQLQQQQQKRYSDALKKKRAYQEIAKQAGQQFSGALSSSSPVALNPADVFGAYQSFNAAVRPSLTADAEILNQIIELAKSREATALDERRLKQSESESARDFELRALESGLKIDPQTGQLQVGSQTADPITEVFKQNGGDLLTAKTQDERMAQAKTILAAGGVKQYRQQIPLPQLLNEKENTAREKAFDLMRTSGTVLGAVENRNAAGLGGIQRALPQWMLSDEGVRNRAEVGEITAEKMKEISGAVISEQEVQRLASFLPRRSDREDVIETKSRRIFNAISVGLEMQELAKKNGMTLDEAYVQFADQVYPKFGEEVPDWVSKKKGSKKEQFDADSFLDEMGY